MKKCLKTVKTFLFTFYLHRFSESSFSFFTQEKMFFSLKKDGHTYIAKRYMT